MRTLGKWLLSFSLSALVVAATVFDYIYAYRLMAFITPILFLISMTTLLSETVFNSCYKTWKKMRRNSVPIPLVTAQRMFITVLWIVYGHPVLAILWLITAFGDHLIRTNLKDTLLKEDDQQ
ncbi:hypothetical protein LCGC14_1490580 [marine sediment metagenome]|uniref:Uncharacterized protein n=1 Tax=marine sediment metagenome TaxID=412755 RepID=A0A0F9J7I3_9ZZZZ